MKILLAVLGILSLRYFFQVVETLPKLDTEATATFSGLYLLAVAVFSGLCFIGAAIVSAGEHIAAGRGAATAAETAPVTQIYRPRTIE